MKVKTSALFASRRSTLVVKVTKVIHSTFGDSVCRICNVVGGRADRKTARYVYADSLRRRYVAV